MFTTNIRPVYTAARRPKRRPHRLLRASCIIAIITTGLTLGIAFALSRTHSNPGVMPRPQTMPVQVKAAATHVQLVRQPPIPAISFAYHNQTIQLDKNIASDWLVAGETATAQAVAAYVDELGYRLGIALANSSDLVTATVYALRENEPHQFAVVPADDRTIIRTYCTAARGVNAGALTGLADKLATTYSDVRGWNDAGHIAFQHATQGCQYTVWLSAASQMHTFGAICDAYYSCRVGNSVVLNYDRWQTATAPWNKTHGTLEEYRTLMINHETGHRLGLLDNPTCPAKAQLAPVMMQQSIDLKGCTFNIWPRPAELIQLSSLLGLPAPSGTVSE